MVHVARFPAIWWPSWTPLKAVRNPNSSHYILHEQAVTAFDVQGGPIHGPVQHWDRCSHESLWAADILP